jgi:hypothetical protein
MVIFAPLLQNVGRHFSRSQAIRHAECHYMQSSLCVRMFYQAIDQGVSGEGFSRPLTI